MPVDLVLSLNASESVKLQKFRTIGREVRREAEQSEKDRADTA